MTNIGRVSKFSQTVDSDTAKMAEAKAHEDANSKGHSSASSFVNDAPRPLSLGESNAEAPKNRRPEAQVGGAGPESSTLKLDEAPAAIASLAMPQLLTLWQNLLDQRMAIPPNERHAELTAILETVVIPQFQAMQQLQEAHAHQHGVSLSEVPASVFDPIAATQARGQALAELGVTSRVPFLPHASQKVSTTAARLEKNDAPKLVSSLSKRQLLVLWDALLTERIKLPPNTRHFELTHIIENVVAPQFLTMQQLEEDYARLHKVSLNDVPPGVSAPAQANAARANGYPKR